MTAAGIAATKRAGIDVLGYFRLHHRLEKLLQK